MSTQTEASQKTIRLQTEADGSGSKRSFKQQHLQQISEVKKEPKILVNDGVEIKKILEEINKAYSNIGECVICFEETPLNNVFDPCGHNCVCNDCIHQGLAKECPICRAEVLNVVILYNQLQVDQ